MMMQIYYYLNHYFVNCMRWAWSTKDKSWSQRVHMHDELFIRLKVHLIFLIYVFIYLIDIRKTPPSKLVAWFDLSQLGLTYPTITWSQNHYGIGFMWLCPAAMNAPIYMIFLFYCLRDKRHHYQLYKSSPENIYWMVVEVKRWGWRP